MLPGSDPEKFAAVKQLFERAGFTPDIKPDIIHWLWMHHAINAAGIGVALWAGGIDQAVGNAWTIRRGVLAAREALQVVAARGVDLEPYPEASQVLKTPLWIAAIATMASVKLTRKGRRLLQASHFSHSPDEMRRYYFDVLETGERLGVPMPHLSGLRDRIQPPQALRAPEL
jgi:2-dehydropantoate 2-reductase